MRGRERETRKDRDSGSETKGRRLKRRQRRRRNEERQRDKGRDTKTVLHVRGTQREREVRVDHIRPKGKESVRETGRIGGAGVLFVPTRVTRIGHQGRCIL